MGDMKKFVEDFLYVINNEEYDKYKHKDWDWDNLPNVEIMFDVIAQNKRRHEK